MSGETRPSAFMRALRLLGGPAPLLAGGARRPASHVVVVVARDNPSFDYFLAPRLAAADGGRTFEVVELGDSPERVLSGRPGAYVLLCRYSSADWTRAVLRRRSSLAGVGLFIDDDIEALIEDSTAPLAYRANLYRRHVAHRRALAGALDRVFVSTEVLMRRYRAATPVLIGPAASREDAPVSQSGGRRPRVCFHVGGAHVAELRWALPVLEAVANRRPDIEVEIVADLGRPHRARGVVVRPFLPWPEYRRETAVRGATLLLAPLLDSAANRARAPTKRIDAARMGAAMVTNAAEIYRPSSEEATSGMVAPLDGEAWTRRIVELLDAPHRLAHLATLNARHVAQWRPDGWRMLFGHDSD